MKRTSIDETLPPLHIVSWSGGKDSTATIIIARKLGLPIDLIIISLVWFDKKRKIYGENPKKIKWIFEYAIPLFESWGYKVKVLTSERDYMYFFHRIKTKSKNPENNGKKCGFIFGGGCEMQQQKVIPIRKFYKSLNRKYIEYVGICIDEPERIERMRARDNQRSLLAEQKITQPQARALCFEEGLLCPTYKNKVRDGCWFCPNQSTSALAEIKTEYPEYWHELELLSLEENTVTKGFKYGKTFQEVNEEIDRYLSRPIQLSIFDSIYSE